MKILGVRFKNLNSLVGEWEVNFTDPEYVSDGIFAITGPTGAGKTTILDAICLGLYGKTPRLDRVTKSSNEIMSRQTGECFSEVTFETQKGCYRCHWSQHRARKKAEGELQPARHEIADADAGTVLESKLTRVADFVENATGMDFRRFTRSMMLAQGDFAAFLSAPPDERAPILEQITGTEIYSQISVKVHERHREEREKLELLQAELKGITILSEAEIKSLQSDIAEKKRRENELEANMKKLRKAEGWCERIAKLDKESAELEAKLRDLEFRGQAFAPDAKRLEKANKAHELEGDYKGVETLRTQQKDAAKELEGARVRLPELEKECVNALADKKSAEEKLEKARSLQRSEAALIKQVRELDTRLSEQKKQIEEKEKFISDTEKQATVNQQTVEKTKQDFDKSKKVLESVVDYLNKHETDAALVTNLAAIERGFLQFRDCEAKLAEVCRATSEAEAKKQAALKSKEKAETEYEESCAAFEKVDAECKKLAVEVGAILKGADIGALRDERDALKDKAHRLMQAQERIDRIDQTGCALENLVATLEKVRVDHKRFSGEISSAKDNIILLEKDIAALETEVFLRGRIRDLDEERKRLEDGKPCPLCGATDHPFARGNVPELDKAEARLSDKKAELKKASEGLQTLEKKEVKAAEGIRLAEREIAEKTKAQAEDEKELIDTLSKLSIEILSENRATEVRKETESAQVKIREISDNVDLVEKKSKAEKSAQVELEKRREDRDDRGKALERAKHDLKLAGLDRERLGKENETAIKAMEKARDAVLSDLKPHGISEILAADVDTVHKDFSDRKDRWLAKQNEKAEHEKTISGLRGEIEKTEALMRNLEADLTAQKKVHGDLKQKHLSLEASRKGLFGEKDADKEEKRLEDAVELAEKRLEKIREAHGRAEKESVALKEKIGFLEDGIEKRAKELVAADTKLKARIRASAFENEAAVLSARLSEDERNRLAEKEKLLVKEKTELDARKRDKAKALVSEREKRLTDEPLHVVRENIGACEKDLKQISSDIGGITKTLSENEKMREKQAERIKNIDAQKAECTRWENLHQLIGSADGKKFRNFAQGLTFEMMTAHANNQLKKMTDRYLLVRDTSQPLELNVIDNYQAGEIRSTKNLSGGESFIVSLALALGLSQMASRNVRVDSLFLDEGFGTLDDDALETALETLSELQQEAKLIGVISHVKALKERIGVQIQVTAGTGGRSHISGPGCRRL